MNEDCHVSPQPRQFDWYKYALAGWRLPPDLLIGCGTRLFTYMYVHNVCMQLMLVLPAYIL